jgi:uncharacterized protein (UPF0332 family)
MTPEAERSLDKADQCLITARAELGIGLGSEAGRNAYLAAFPAARAFIFERIGKVVKRHESLHREFTRLAKDEPGYRQKLFAFLSQGYNLKAIADYDTTPGSFVSPRNTPPLILRQEFAWFSASDVFSRRVAAPPRQPELERTPKSSQTRRGRLGPAMRSRSRSVTGVNSPDPSGCCDRSALVLRGNLMVAAVGSIARGACAEISGPSVRDLVYTRSGHTQCYMDSCAFESSKGAGSG